MTHAARFAGLACLTFFRLLIVLAVFGFGALYTYLAWHFLGYACIPVGLAFVFMSGMTAVALWS